MRHDFRFALRALGRSPGFTLAAIATLALGLGANAFVFSLVDALLLRPLPLGDRTPRLVTLHSIHPTQARDWDDSALSHADLVELREHARSLAQVEGFDDRNFSLVGTDATERVLGASITPGLFSLLGISPAIGRDFLPDEGAEPGFEQVAIISDDLWRRRFAADPDVVGRAAGINGRALTIVGVMPPRFGFPERQDLWVPYAGDPAGRRNQRSLIGVGLLAGGASVADVRADVGTVAARLAAAYPDTNRGWGIHAMPMREFFVGGGTRRGAAAMLGAVALVLLVACANVAGLLLARGVGRERELTIRAALGAGRWPLIRLVLAESAILAAAGAASGLLLATGGLRFFLATTPEPPPFWMQFAIDARVALFLVAASVAATAAAGLIPALRVSRVDLAASMQGSRAAGTTRGQQTIQGVLVTGQVAVSLALLIGAALLSESARRLQTADAGFDPRPMLSLRLYVAGDAYDDPAVRAAAIDRIAERLAAIPGATAAAATGAIPSDDGGTPLRIVPPGGAATPEEELGAHGLPVTSRFWEVLGLDLREGRTFLPDEIRDPASRAVIVNERLARTLWPGEEATGRELTLREGDGTQIVRVVGVAPDLVFEELGEETASSRLQIYFPWAVMPWRSMALLVRAGGDPSSLATPVRSAIREIDPHLAVFDVMTMPQRRRYTHWTETFLGRIFSGFGAAAMALACIGVYGLAAYSAARRRREIGIRFALGATRGAVVRLLLRRGGRLAIAGIAIGAPLAIAAAKVLENLLFGVSPWQAGIWLAVPLALLAAVLVATWAPARRASLADPADALRWE